MNTLTQRNVHQLIVATLQLIEERKGYAGTIVTVGVIAICAVVLGAIAVLP